MNEKEIKKSKNTTLPFILVSDKIIANRLKENGFICVSETDTMFTFLNNGKLVFSDEIDKNKVAYSNMLCI